MTPAPFEPIVTRHDAFGDERRLRQGILDETLSSATTIRTPQSVFKHPFPRRHREVELSQVW
jgi:hypothetical protein